MEITEVKIFLKDKIKKRRLIRIKNVIIGEYDRKKLGMSFIS